MKIFVMDFIMPPGVDGSYTHMWEFLREMSKLGHEIHILSYKEYRNIKFNQLNIHIISKKKDRLGRLLFVFFLLKLIKTHHFDVLYSRILSKTNGIIGYIAKKFLKSKLVFEINGIIFLEKELIRQELNRNKSSKIKKLLGNLIIKYCKYKEIFMWNLADALITVTAGIKQYLIDYGVNKDKIWVVANGANTNLFRPMDKGIAQSELELDKVNKYVCFVGFLAPWQGVEYLIQAAPLVVKNMQAKFLIVGDGPIRDKLEKMVKNLSLNDNFIFIGTVPYEDVPKYINASDICVVPKRKIFEYGYSPLKLYEYMACGKPVVATNIAGFEIVEQYNTGILVNPEDPYELSNAIIELLQNKQLREQMGASGRKLVVREYSWENTAKKVTEVFRNLLK